MSSMPTYKYAIPADTEAAWNATSFIIPLGVQVLAYDVGKFKIGDGVHKFSDLAYGNEIKSVVGSGGASVTNDGNGNYKITVSGTGGDMLLANYANGTGQSNTNTVDHAIYSDNTSHATLADTATNATNSTSVTGIRTFAIFPVGFITDWPTETAPDHTLLCNGQAVSRTTYSDLFNVIGTRCGAGDGTSTFNVPNYCKRVSAGYDPSDTQFNTIGQTMGSTTCTLTADQVPSLPIKDSSGSVYKSKDGIVQGSTTPYWLRGLTSGSGTDRTVYATGGGQSHSIMQPTIVMNKIIVY